MVTPTPPWVRSLDLRPGYRQVADRAEDPAAGESDREHVLLLLHLAEPECEGERGQERSDGGEAEHDERDDT